MDRSHLIAFGWATFVFLDVSYLTYYLCGKFVDWFHARVAYTRKAMHVVTFALPWTLQRLFGLEDSVWAAIAASLLVPLHMVIFIKPIRKRFPLVATMFRGIERPEDRPYTLWWLMSQFGAAYAVYAGLYAAMIARDVTEWMIIPLLVLAFGDGLAEPVGVRFGKHPYTTTPLNGKRRYRRTLEGSACVFLTAVITIMVCHFWFTPRQLIVAMAVIPISGTVTEAKAPHTWDQPLILLVLGLELLAISYV